MAFRGVNKFVFAASLLLALVAGAWFVRSSPLPFDASIWESGSPRESDVRLRMARWITIFGTLEGRPKQEVRQLLGEPSGDISCPAADLVYDLGTESDGFLGIVGRLLLVHTRNGKVEKAEIFEWRD